MEFLISAVASDLISRFISYLTQNYSDHTCKQDDRRRLERILLRMHSVVEEAEGHHITNRGMLLQLKAFIEGFYLGHYMLDKIKFQPPEEESIDDEVVVIGRTEDIAKFGTTQPIRVKRLSEEEYWYYFKALAFGSMDPDEHPKLASLGLQVAEEMNGSFLGATVIGEILRANPNTQFWQSILLCLRELAHKHLSSCGLHPDILFESNIPVDFTRIAFVGAQVQAYMVYDLRVADRAQSELPNLTSREIILGNIPVEDKFDALVWRSRIPPYCDYIATFEKRKPRRMLVVSEEETAFAVGGFLDRGFSPEAAPIRAQNYSNHTCQEDDRKRLERILLRMHSVVEEAEGRYITNQGMLLQLKGLIEGFYLGCYMLDKIKFQPPEEESIRDEVSHEIQSFALPTSNSAKRFRFADAIRKHTPVAFGSWTTTNLKDVVDSLETKIKDMREFVMLLGSYPRLPRQPYSTYLYIDKCMFGRRIEKEQVIKFLLFNDPHDPVVSILPIIGPRNIGKKTLMQHACQDERVRNSFSHIFFFKEDDLKIGELSVNSKASPGKYLYMIEFIWDVDEAAWTKFQSYLQNMAATEIKVVVLSRTEDIAKFGTCQPIRVKRLSEEEYWYYFKVLAFGSMDPDEHPKLASLGLQVANEMNASFIGASFIGELLRSNPNTQFWKRILLCFRELTREHLSSSGLHHDNLFERNIPVDATTFFRVSSQVQSLLVYDLRVVHPAQSELPNVSSREILLGGDMPVEDKFDALVWKSRIPPYCAYIATYEKRKPQSMLYSDHVSHFISFQTTKEDREKLKSVLKIQTVMALHLVLVFRENCKNRHAAAMEAKFSQLAAAEFHQICCIKRKSANKIRGNAWRERSSSERGRDGWPERDRLVGFSSEAARFKVLYGDSPPCAPDDLISQFISSVAQNYSNHTCKEDDCKRLERILLRMHSVVEEAEGLYITNQGMLRQLKGLTKDFYLRYYMLDKIKFQPPEEESIRDEVSHEIQSFALSTFNSAKRFPFADAIGKHRPIVFGRSRTNLKDVVDGLETKITDMREFVMFLGGYPRLPRQPYKDDQKIGEVSLNSKASPGKYLFVIEFILDVDEAAWTKFRSYLQNMTVTGIKVIVMSRTEDIAKFGTCQPIKMQRLSEEEYWYYFKALSFGSVDPDEHPNLASLGMQVANELNRSFIGATVIGDLISRFISSVAKNYSNHTCKDDDLRRLERILLRMHSIVEETDGRHITNQGMLLQLKGFIEGFYLGHYTLDKIKFQPTEEGCIEDEVSHEIHSFALSTCNSAKRFRFADAVRKHTPIAFGSRSTTNLKGFIEDLETMIKDMREFVMLLGSYPCLPRQPYGTYLNIDKCMFGRRIEKEQVINFLLCNDPHDPFVSILPIIGPRNIGKKTLVQHACLDERVSNFFSHIFFFKEYDLKIGELSVNTKASPGKYLFVIEFIWDVDEVAWTKFQSYLQNMDGIGIKVVILSRTEDIAKFGTCQPIRIKRLSEEEYWYYFKALAFGSMNPDEHPKLASLGLQVANEMNGSFIGATLIGEILRANPNTQFWKRMLFFLRELARKHLYSCGAHPEDLLERNIPIVTTIFCVGVQVQAYLVYDLRVAGHTQSELPNMTSQEILLGNIPVEDKFDVLVWKSRIPPYCAYIATHEKQKPRFKT
uniref:Uncharacterized protein n=1 Tax=Leersia perrieri TaxID=77586 RepID=A0A0D9XPC8_9ORYZ